MPDPEVIIVVIIVPPNSNCNVCGKDVGREKNHSGDSTYDGRDGWICDQCFATEIEFYIGLGFKFPEKYLKLLREIRSK